MVHIGALTSLTIGYVVDYSIKKYPDFMGNRRMAYL